MASLVKNSNQISSFIAEKIYNGTNQIIQENAKKYFVFSTKEKIKNLTALKDLQKQLKQMEKELSENNGDVPLLTYFNAYELILDVRTFFLGELGEIDYSILFSSKIKGGDATITTITISHEIFRDLLINSNGELKGLIKSGDNFRFNTALTTNLKAILKQLNKNGVSFSMINNNAFKIKNEVVGASSQFKSAKLFKSLIDNSKIRAGNRYNFQIDVKQDIDKKNERKIFSYFINKVEGSVKSSSVFSAIGKYSADEQIARETIIKKVQNRIFEAPYPNAGNLSEIYILAKDLLNEGKNKFSKDGSKRVAISGKKLYQIYSQVLKNTDPFYTGGDKLTEQIKSFLGSCPSLTSFSTIKETVIKFRKALQEENLDLLEKKMSQLLIKKGNNLLKAENDYAKQLTKKLEETFQFLKK